MRLKDKVAVVTGGGSGFGAGVVQKFVAEGARVIVADLKKALPNARIDNGADLKAFAAATAAKVVMPTSGRLAASAKPRAAAKPARRPVK